MRGLGLESLGEHRPSRAAPTPTQVPTRPRLPLSPALRAQQAQVFKQRLDPFIRAKLDVHVTDNRTVMISVKRNPEHRRYRVRLHHLFVDAPDSILEALARYILHNDRASSRELSGYIERCDHRVASDDVSSRRAVLRTKGRSHDLALIFTRLEQRYFSEKLEVGITWGRHAAMGRPRGSIRLGSYTLEERLIRIHPGLDQGWVPERYVAWVVYHEMLHAVHPVDLVNGRRHFHTPAFARDERRYEYYEWARTWEQRNIAALLSL